MKSLQLLLKKIQTNLRRNRFDFTIRTLDCLTSFFTSLETKAKAGKREKHFYIKISNKGSFS